MSLSIAREEMRIQDSLFQSGDASQHDTAGLTQEELADRMGRTKSVISRLESSLRNEKHSPSYATLRKYAQACGKKLVVQLV